MVVLRWLSAIGNLENVKGDNDDQNVGINIVRRAIQAPARQISDNAGADGAVIVGKLVEEPSDVIGYNAQAGVFEDLIKAGVIDPTKVVRSALAKRSICCKPADHNRSYGW